MQRAEGIPSLVVGGTLKTGMHLHAWVHAHMSTGCLQHTSCSTCCLTLLRGCCVAADALMVLLPLSPLQDAALPPVAPGTCRRAMLQLLLRPPPLPVARRIAKAVELMQGGCARKAGGCGAVSGGITGAACRHHCQAMPDRSVPYPLPTASHSSMTPHPTHPGDLGGSLPAYATALGADRVMRCISRRQASHTLFLEIVGERGRSISALIAPTRTLGVCALAQLTVAQCAS